MSEIQSRPAPRGRSSVRGGSTRGRGGARGGSRHVNGDHKAASEIDTSADQGEIGEMKKQYSSEVAMLKEMFPDWTDVDLVFALEETNGDLPSTIERITEGNVSQFSEVPKKSKDRARSKVKDSSTGAADPSMATSRPSRGRGGEPPRGARGRGDRARGGFRGGARGGQQSTANGVRGPSTAKSVPTTESGAWDSIPSANKENESMDSEGAPGGQWASVVASEATPNTASEGAKSSLIPDGGAKKTWASMFAQPKPTPGPVSKPEVKAPLVPELEPHVPEVVEPTPVLPPEIEETPEAPPVEPPAEEVTPAITPSKDELTEDNVEHVPDYSNKPPTTETAASQVGSNRDIGSATPSVAQLPMTQLPIGRPGLGGFATAALKATTPTGRSASFQRRIAEQQEAVVMPGSAHAVDRAAVQFGMMGLSGDELDVDEDREEAETRPQAPPQSPPSQPRASLPPAPRQPPPPETAPETLPTPKQSHGLPPPPQQSLSHQQQSPHPIGAQLGGQGTQAYNQFGRYGQQSAQAETAAPPQKPYDPFGQQVSQSPLDAYNASTQAPQPGPSQLGGQSSAPTDYSSYQTSDYQRNAYQNYYGNYGQQHASSQQDAGTTQQRAGSGFGSAPGDSGYGSQSQQSTAPSRYGESQNSGHNTPNPALGGAGHQSQQGQHLQQHHQQGQHAGGAGFPYAGHPYYNSPYYQAYMNQYNYGGQGFGQPYGGGGNKGAMYNQPHHGYGISPQQSSYDQHSSSPANTTGFGPSSLHGGESNLRAGAGGLSDYGRSGSAQPTQGGQTGSSGFGGMSDVFGRQSGFPGANQGYGQQQGGQQSSAEESLKPFGDTKATAGPSPTATLGQPGRPGSATNNTATQGQSGLPPPQNQGFGGGYPGHLAQGSQYGGLGGLGHQGGQNHQGGFGGGYGGGYGGNYGSYGGRGGWGTNYGNH